MTNSREKRCHIGTEEEEEEAELLDTGGNCWTQSGT